MTLYRCPACLPCSVDGCPGIGACMDHPSERMCEHDQVRCEEHPCEACVAAMDAESPEWDEPPTDIRVCGACAGHGTVMVRRDPDTGHVVDDTCPNCYGTGELPC